MSTEARSLPTGAAGGAGVFVLPMGWLALWVLLVANCALSVVQPGLATTLAATVLWLWAVSKLLRADTAVTIMLVPFITLHLSVLASLSAIEAGAYMREMGATGSVSTASASYVLYSLLFLLIATAVCRRHVPYVHQSQSGHEERPFLLVWGALAIAVPIVLYLLAAGLRTGFPLLTSTDRFAYRMVSADVLTLNFLNLKFVIGSLLGSSSVFAASLRRRWCHHLVFFAYLAVSFLFGDKFFIVLMAAGFYLMPFIIKDPQLAARSLKAIAPAALLVVTGVFSVTAFIYSDYGNLSLDQTATKLSERIAGQGQLWFLAVRDNSHLASFDTQAVRENLASLTANPGAVFVFEHRLGPFYFVEKYAPYALYRSFINNGGAVTPTMVMEAYALVNFGYLGLAAVMALLGVLIGVLLRWLRMAMMSGNPFNVLLPAFVVTQALSMMAQATLYSLVGLSAWKAYAAFFVLQTGVAWFISLNQRPATVGGLHAQR